MHAADRLSQYYKDLMKLSNECRSAHEQGDVNIIKKSAAEPEKNQADFSNTDNTLQNKTFHVQTNNWETDSPAISADLLDPASRPSTSNCGKVKGRNQEKLMAQESEHSRISSFSTSRGSFTEMEKADSPMCDHHNAEQHEPM